jgi:thymidylate synthase
MNTLDKQYTDLLQDILDNGVTKKDRTGTGTISVFGRQIRHKMSDGFPLLTTKKMHFKSIATELIWFLRGDTNIKFLLDNGCHIWTGDAYKHYITTYKGNFELDPDEFIDAIKTNPEFAEKRGELGPIYGKQWRKWHTRWDVVEDKSREAGLRKVEYGIDQIANLINDLKTNPDSRRLMVNAWNVGELDQMVLPPCHYGFQVYTRELSRWERQEIYIKKWGKTWGETHGVGVVKFNDEGMDKDNIPTRAISLMWNQRSVDTFLGLPFNIASYGLLLEIIAKAVNMVPDELIGNLGDVHLYSNHIEQAKEQIGRELTYKERYDIWFANNYQTGIEYNSEVERDFDNQWGDNYEEAPPYRTREPYPLPTLNINTEFWSYEGGSCGEGPLDAVAVFNSFADDTFCKCLLEEDIQLGNYQSHTSIKAPLSN